MPKMVRNPECNLYNECLDIAYKNRVKEFGCEGCDGKTIFKLQDEVEDLIKKTDEIPKNLLKTVSKTTKRKPRAMRPRGGHKKNRRRANLDFIDYPELNDAINKEAVKNFRSFNMQVLYWCKKGYEAEKEKEGPGEEENHKMSVEKSHGNVIENIKKEVSAETGVSIKELESQSRKQHIVRARKIAMKRCREWGVTLKNIGKAFNRTHATVIHSITQKEV